MAQSLMEIDITIKNYRCFSDQHPVHVTWRPGFTAFVGPNNSGKSSLLRFIYELRPLLESLWRGGAGVREAFRGSPQGFPLAPSVLDPNEIFSNHNTRPLQIEFRVDPSALGHPPGEYRVPERLALTIPRGTHEWTGQLLVGDRRVSPTGSGPSGPGVEVLLVGDERFNLAPLFEALQILSRGLYVGPFRNAINLGAKQDYFDIDVGQAFIKRWREYKTGPIKQRNEATYRVEEDVRRIFGYDSVQINASNDEETLQLFVDGRSYKLGEMGSGLAQFVIVLANAAVRRPAYVLIDEPELNLHPSLQLEFLTSLTSYTTEGAVLFATHSIGLARAAADRILTFRIADDGGTEVKDLESTPRLSEFLGELGFSGYRELGFEKLLLVEGVSELRTVQQLLRLYRKDHQVVLLPLGGSQLITRDREPELEEIKRICGKVHVVIDSERGQAEAPLPEDRAAFVKVCEVTKIRYHVLERRALENYFPDHAVKSVKGDKYRALGPYEALKEVPLSWGKAENWRIAREMTEQDLEGTDLGKFLSDL